MKTNALIENVISLLYENNHEKSADFLSYYFKKYISKEDVEVIEYCAKIWDFTLEDLKSKERTNKHAFARYFSINYLINQKYKPIVIMQFLNKNRTTFYNAVKEHSDLLETDDIYKEKYIDFINYAKLLKNDKQPNNRKMESCML